MDELWQRYRGFWTPVLWGVGVFLAGLMVVHMLTEDPDAGRMGNDVVAKRIKERTVPAARQIARWRTKEARSKRPRSNSVNSSCPNVGPVSRDASASESHLQDSRRDRSGVKRSLTSACGLPISGGATATLSPWTLSRGTSHGPEQKVG